MITLNREKIEQFQKVVYRFFRDNGVNRKEMAELLKLQFENFASDDEKTHRSWEDQRKRLSKEAIDDFRKMLDEFVQKSIDFVRKHEDVKKAIAEDTEEIIKEWNPDLKEGEESLMYPDLRLSFGVDGLESSVEAGKWVCDTDSGISLSIGRREILQMM